MLPYHSVFSAIWRAVKGKQIFLKRMCCILTWAGLGRVADVTPAAAAAAITSRGSHTRVTLYLTPVSTGKWQNPSASPFNVTQVISISSFVRQIKGLQSIKSIAQMGEITKPMIHRHFHMFHLADTISKYFLGFSLLVKMWWIYVLDFISLTLVFVLYFHLFKLS